MPVYPTKFSFLFADSNQSSPHYRFSPGERVSGKVSITLSVAKDNVSDVSLKFLVQEDCVVVRRVEDYGAHHQRNHRRTVKETSQETLAEINMSIPPGIIIQPGRRITAGTYEVPFDFSLPANIVVGTLGTGGAVSKGSSSATLFMGMKCSIRQPQNTVEGTHAMKIGGNSQPQQQSSRSSGAKAYKIQKGLASWNLGGSSKKDYGTIYCGAKLVEGYLSPGKVPQVKLGIMNQSKAHVEHVMLSIEQHVKWSAEKHYVTLDTTLCQRKVAQAVPGSDSFSTGSNQDQQYLAAVAQELDRVTHANDPTLFALPPIPAFVGNNGTIGSYKGVKLNVHHTLSVFIKTLDKYHDISFQIPIQIGHAPPSLPPRAAALPVAQVQPSAPYEHDVKSAYSSSLPVASATPVYDLDTNVATAIAASPSGGVADEVEC